MFDNVATNRVFIVEEIRRNTLRLVAKSYSSLEVTKLCKYIGCDLQKSLAIAEDKGWKSEGSFVFPTPIDDEIPESRSEYNAFEKLTDSISFLEN